MPRLSHLFTRDHSKTWTVRCVCYPDLVGGGSTPKEAMADLERQFDERLMMLRMQNGKPAIGTTQG